MALNALGTRLIYARNVVWGKTLDFTTKPSETSLASPVPVPKPKPIDVIPFPTPAWSSRRFDRRRWTNGAVAQPRCSFAEGPRSSPTTRTDRIRQSPRISRGAPRLLVRASPTGDHRKPGERAATGPLARPKAMHELTHQFGGSRCVALSPLNVQEQTHVEIGTFLHAVGQSLKHPLALVDRIACHEDRLLSVPEQLAHYYARGPVAAALLRRPSSPNPRRHRLVAGSRIPCQQLERACDSRRRQSGSRQFLESRRDLGGYNAVQHALDAGWRIGRAQVPGSQARSQGA